MEIDRKEVAKTFIKNNDIKSIIIEEFITQYFTTEDGIKCWLPIILAGKNKPIGAKCNLTLEELSNPETPIYNMIKNDYSNNFKRFAMANSSKLYYELRPKFRNILIIDVDGKNSNDDAYLEDILNDPNLPVELKTSHFTLSRTKALPHFYISVPDLPDYIVSHYTTKNAINVIRNFKADILFNSCWEKYGSQVYNYSGELQEVSWNVILNWIKPVDELDDNNKILLGQQPKSKKKNSTNIKQHFPEPEPKQNCDDDNSVVSSLSTNSQIIVDLNETKNAIRLYQQCWSEGKLNTYANWRDFTFAIMNKLGDNGKDIWDEISQKYQGYNFNENNKKWDEMKKTIKKDGKKIGLNRLREWAEENDPEKLRNLIPNLFEVDWFRLTDAEYARIMYNLYFKNKLIFTGNDKSTQGYLYNNIYWKPLSQSNSELFKENFTNLYNHLKCELGKIVDYIDEDDVTKFKILLKTLDSQSRRNDVIKVLKTDTFTSGIEWNADKNLFAFDDGIYDLSQDKFIEPSPSQYINLTTGYSLGLIYEKNGDEIINIIVPNYQTEKIWIYENFIKQITTSDRMAENMIEITSTFLDGRNSRGFMWFWTGTGRNGKGTFTEIGALSFGNYYGELSMNYWVNNDKSSSAPNAELCNLKDARWINSSEIPEQDGNPAVMCLDKIKRFTGGDNVKARRLYSNDEISYKAGVCVAQLNIMPTIPKIYMPKEHSTRDRVKVLPFKFSFISDTSPDFHKVGIEPNLKKCNTGIKERWNEINYRRAFILMLFEKNKELKTNPLVLCQEIQDATNEYINKNDTINWLKNNLIKVEKDEVGKHSLSVANILEAIKSDVSSKLKKKDLVEDIKSTFGTAKQNDGYGFRNMQGYGFVDGYKFIDE